VLRSRSTPSRVVRRSRAGPAAHQRLPGHQIHVEGVQRLAQLQHHVVWSRPPRCLWGGPRPWRRRICIHRGEGPGCSPLISRAVKRGQRSGSSTTALPAVGRPGRPRLGRERAQRHPVVRRQVAGQPVDRHGVGTVQGDRDLEQHVRKGQGGGEVGPHREVAAEHQDAGGLLASAPTRTPSRSSPGRAPRMSRSPTGAPRPAPLPPWRAGRRRRPRSSSPADHFLLTGARVEAGQAQPVRPGWGRTSSTRATTTPEKGASTRCIPSTSWPRLERAAATSSHPRGCRQTPAASAARSSELLQDPQVGIEEVPQLRHS